MNIKFIIYIGKKITIIVIKKFKVQKQEINCNILNLDILISLYILYRYII